MRLKWFFIAIVVFLSCLSGIREAYGSTKNQSVFLQQPTLLATPNYQKHVLAASSIPTPTIPFQISKIRITEQKYVHPIPSPTQKPTSGFGVSRQIDEHTWTIQVGQDSTTGTSQQILTALNNYRSKKGRSPLSWNATLGSFAQSRASFFVSKGTLDGHAGFMDYINNQDGFHKLGFGSLGENSSYGYTLEATHLIELVYAGDKPHDDNQLSSDWSHVGIGVSGSATDLVFGGKKF